MAEMIIVEWVESLNNFTRGSVMCIFNPRPSNIMRFERDIVREDNVIDIQMLLIRDRVLAFQEDFDDEEPAPLIGRMIKWVLG